jgi:ketosteroid isomerase-like protein
MGSAFAAPIDARFFNATPSLEAAMSSTTPFSDPELAAFVRRLEHAVDEFLNGNNRPWLELASRSGDATIMGAWGAYELGWSQVGARYEWAAAQFRPSGAKATVQYLASGASGDFAYTVAIERSEPMIAGHEQRRRSELRVTHVFRREGGQWRFVHRHADPLVAKTTPS